MEVVGHIRFSVSFSAMEDEAAIMLAVARRGMNQVEAAGKVIVGADGFTISALDSIAQCLGKRPSRQGV